MISEEDIQKDKEQMEEVKDPSQVASRFGIPGEGGMQDGYYRFPVNEKLFVTTINIGGQLLRNDEGKPIKAPVAWAEKVEKSGNRWVVKSKVKVFLSFLKRRFEEEDPQTKDHSGTFRRSDGTVVDDFFGEADWLNGFTKVLATNKVFRVEKESFSGFRFGDEKSSIVNIYHVNW